MRCYTQQHRYYCGIDLHARKMYVCIIDNTGKIHLHENFKTDPEILFEIIFPYLQEDIVVAVECVFCWYWVSDLCADHNIPYNLPEFGKKISLKYNREGVAERFDDPSQGFRISAPMPG